MFNKMLWGRSYGFYTYHNTRWILDDRKATCMSIFKPIKWCDRTTYDETLARSIKQSTQQREKGRRKISGPSPNYKSKTQTWSHRGRSNKLCSSKPSLVTSSISKRNGNLKEFSKLRRALTCNDHTSQNKNSNRSLQSYNLRIHDTW